MRNPKWYEGAKPACSIVPIRRFVTDHVFALKNGGYGYRARPCCVLPLNVCRGFEASTSVTSAITWLRSTFALMQPLDVIPYSAIMELWNQGAEARTSFSESVLTDAVLGRTQKAI